jgi:biotin carboxyl carrier protein
MLKLVRQFLKNNSPDWLNTEVNKDLLQNLTANIKSTPKNNDINSAPLRKGGWGDLNVPMIDPHQSTVNGFQLSDRSNGLSNNHSLPTVKGKPHWRRINQVFQTLDTAPENATYNQLIEYVKETTGVGCSRKLISKWKKQNTSHEFPDQNSEDYHLEQSTPAIAFSSTSIPSTVNSFQLTELSSNSSNDNSLDRRSLLPVKAWTYLTAAGMTIALVGCELLPFQLSNNRLTENIAFARTSQGGELNSPPVSSSVTTPLPPLPPTPETRKNRLEPNNIKIELTLNNPQDLKVKPGDKVSAGQTLSNRASERNRLQAKKKQLQLSVEKLNLPLASIPQPRPIPEINSLPPVSYAEEEAEIKLKQQNLKEAENAIALQQKKIESLTQLQTSPSHLSKGGGEMASPLIRGIEGDRTTPNLKLILEHEQANLKNLETAKTDAQIQLEVQESQLTTAKEQRAYIEYQRELEQTRRAIAISQQHQTREQTESERQVLLAEREYSIAQIETQIQEIDYQIEQLSTVKAPYEGTIKKVKWTGQSDHNLTALITLAVDDHRATIANDRNKSVNSHQ